MLEFHNFSSTFVSVSFFFRIFASMSNEDKDIIERLLNRDKNAEDEILKLCDFSINYFIFHNYEYYADKATLKQVLARELYYYFIKKDLLRKFEGKNGCRLETYLNSIAKFVLHIFQQNSEMKRHLMKTISMWELIMTKKM